MARIILTLLKKVSMRKLWTISDSSMGLSMVPIPWGSVDLPIKDQPRELQKCLEGVVDVAGDVEVGAAAGPAAAAGNGNLVIEFPDKTAKLQWGEGCRRKQGQQTLDSSIAPTLPKMVELKERTKKESKRTYAERCDSIFRHMVEQVKTYPIEEATGRRHVPQNDRGSQAVVNDRDKKLPPLGWWVDAQRIQYKLFQAGKYSCLTKAMLDGARFVWDASEKEGGCLFTVDDEHVEQMVEQVKIHN